MWHPFNTDISSLPLPEKFTFPFHYTPHPLCVRAAGEVKEYLAQQTEWEDELWQGKMFGVLVAENARGEVGFLAAFSGLLNGSNHLPYFVPPVYDLQHPDGFFKIEEARITALNHQIQQLESNPSYLQALREIKIMQSNYEAERTAIKEVMKRDKAERDILRKEHADDAGWMKELIHQSQFQKAELKRMENAWKLRIQEQEAIIDKIALEIEALKKERKNRSATLQSELFRHYRILNAQGEAIDLTTLFANSTHSLPPGGAGDCAAPKLLQYAYQQRLRPLAMAEFWWGHAPNAEMRRHGAYYPACQSKCAPILQFMLQGMEVEDNPLYTSQEPSYELKIVYEDTYLMIIDKPSGLQSVPGKSDSASLYSLVRKLRPLNDGMLMVHRLDQATSGLVLIAKTKAVHEALQKQFLNRSIKKRYTAILEKEITEEMGEVTLPLCPNPTDRPRQMVHPTLGKPTHTTYEVIEKTEGKTRIRLYPHTGRTHQLRVHAAHPDGLYAPIQGDKLYGAQSTEGRLCLHADRLEFTHPITHERIIVEINVPF